MKPTARRRAARPSGAHMGEEHLTLMGQSAAGAASRRAMAPARPGASFRQVRDEGRGSRASTPEISSPGPRRPPPRVSRSRSRSAGWWVGHATTAWRVGRKRFGGPARQGCTRTRPGASSACRVRRPEVPRRAPAAWRLPRPRGARPLQLAPGRALRRGSKALRLPVSIQGISVPRPSMTWSRHRHNVEDASAIAGPRPTPAPAQR